MASYSRTSSSPWGGADYDELCKGVVQYYSFNLCDLDGYEEVRDVVDVLYRQIVATTDDLQIGSDKRIGRLYIGKTYVNANKRQVFDPMKLNTFRKTGISNRWKKHKNEDYGRDGMVVLGVITREIAASLEFEDDPKGTYHWCSKQEKCALKIEEKLQYHFRNDGRFPHRTYRRGRTTEGGGAIGYVIYLCFSYLDKRRP